MAAGAKMGLRGFFRAEVVREEGGEIHRSQKARGDGAAVLSARPGAQKPCAGKNRVASEKRKA